ncbi:MAG: hypothetical protein AB7G75_36435 [Candidatus Binatia bacterium]
MAKKIHEHVTLLDLVQSISQCSKSDEEVVATIAYLINTGKVQVGNDVTVTKISWSSPLDVFPAWARPKLPPVPPRPALAA